MKNNRYRSIAVLFALFWGTMVIAQTSQHLLWEIRAPKSNVVSYIYASSSFPDKRVFELNDSVVPCLKATQVFAPQLALNAENSEQIKKAMLLEGTQTLDSVFTPEEMQQVATEFERITGQAIADYLKLKPFALMSTALFAQIKGDSKVLLNDHLQNIAEKNGKDIVSLERVVDQLKYWELLPIASVLAYFNNPTYYGEEQNKMLQLYLHKALDALADASLYQDEWTHMRQLLLKERNNLLKTRLEQLFVKLSTFAVVDGVHLAGDNGILDLLKADGFVVRPVEAILTKKTEFVPEITWKQFNENENVSFFLPGTPVFEELKVESELGLLTTGSYRYMAQKGDPNIFYGVSYTDYPAHIIHSDFEDMWEDIFNNSGDALITALEGEMIEESNISLRGFPGRETVASFNGGTKMVKFQSFLVGNRLFILQVITDTDRRANSFVGKFFDSFTIKTNK